MAELKKALQVTATGATAAFAQLPPHQPSAAANAAVGKSAPVLGKGETVLVAADESVLY
jgi:hypothetical protein